MSTEEIKFKDYHPVMKVVVIIIFAGFIALIFHRSIIIRLSDIKYTNCYIKETYCNEYENCDVVLYYYANGKKYTKRIIWPDNKTMNFRKGEEVKDGIFYSEVFSSVSFFDYYLYSNPKKKKEIKRKRINILNFEKAIECQSPYFGGP